MSSFIVLFFTELLVKASEIRLELIISQPLSSQGGVHLKAVSAKRGLNDKVM